MKHREIPREHADAFFRKGQQRDLLLFARRDAPAYIGAREKYISRHLRDLRPDDAARARELIIAELDKRLAKH